MVKFDNNQWKLLHTEGKDQVNEECWLSRRASGSESYKRHEFNISQFNDSCIKENTNLEYYK